MIEVGKKAPAFRAKDQSGAEVSLAGEKGRWVVLYFYPKDDTPGCTVEACDFTANLPAFGRLDAVVFGVSRDSVESHAKFAAKHELKVRLLSDPDREILEPYGAFGEKTMYGKKVVGVIRSTVLIDPAGKVAHHWPHVRAKGHADAVKQKLAELRGSS